MKYKIIEKPTIGELEITVELHMKDNWVPLGGIATYYRNNESAYLCYYAQAMIK